MANSQDNPLWVQKLLDVIQSIQYGSVTIIVQDGIVIQMDKNEKFRLTSQKIKKGSKEKADTKNN